MRIDPKIVVIGAGASGLAAATRLISKQYTNIIILEAQNRIGGRIDSRALGDYQIDLGAQWCHGETYNIVYDMAEPLDLLDKSSDRYDLERDTTFIDVNGERLGDERLLLFKLIKEITVEEVFECENDSKIYGDFVMERLEKKLAEEEYASINEPATKELTLRLLNWYHKMHNCYTGCDDWFGSTIKDLLAFRCCPGDQLINWKQRTFSTILDVMMKKLPDGSAPLPISDKIIFNKIVTNINYAHDEYACVVTCADGSEYHADHVIVTVSIGVLRKCINASFFTPALPAAKLSAINRIKMGTVNKFYFLFPERWWPEESYGFSFLTGDELLEEFLAGLEGGVEKNKWLLDVIGFYSVDHKPRVMLGWIFGESARQMEQLDNDEIKLKLMALIKFYLSRQFDIPEPLDFIHSKWHSNPFFDGSYSHPDSRDLVAGGENVSDEYIMDLVEPLNNEQLANTVLFAGEHTHPRFFSTVHGAIETGHREADRIINYYSKKLPILEIPTANRIRLVIIGAGIAGLAAAKTLVDANFHDFVVVEAQNRAGGRIHTWRLNDKNYLDLGAQWLHEKSTPLYHLAKENNLLSNLNSSELCEATEALGVFIRDDGHIFNRQLIDRADFEFGKILNECARFVTEGSLEYPKSIGDFIDENKRRFHLELLKLPEFHAIGVTAIDRERNLNAIFNWLTQFQVIDNSCVSLSQVSARFWGKYQIESPESELSEQHHYTITNGYENIIKKIIEVIDQSHDKKIKYNRKVTEICANKTSRIRIKTMTKSNVNCFECDFVLVTMPIGVLKNSLNIFKPPLPVDYENIILKMGYAVINKIYLIFNQQWWKVPGFQIIWTNFKSEFTSTWMHDLTGFDQVSTCANCLVGWVGSNGARIVEDMAETDIGIECVDFFRKILARNDIPYPQRVIRTKWLSNEFSAGAYSFISTECDEIPLLIEKNRLSDFINYGNGTLGFAGEACHPSKYSTVHGAYESGVLQAGKFLDLIKA